MDQRPAKRDGINRTSTPWRIASRIVITSPSTSTKMMIAMVAERTWGKSGQVTLRSSARTPRSHSTKRATRPGSGAAVRTVSAAIGLLRFLVDLVLVASRAVLLPLSAIGMRALVLRGEVVSVLALAAREDDLVARHRSAYL